MSKIICIYHRVDLDGWMSAAIVKHWFKEKNKEKGYIINGAKRNRGPYVLVESIDFLGWHYGDEIPNLDKYDKIVMCDISFPAPLMFEIQEESFMSDKEFIWLDHHKSAIDSFEHQLEEEELIDVPYPKGLRDTKFSACELTWNFLFPETKMPEIVRLLGRYDCFGHKGTEEEQTVLEFQYGARQSITNYEEAYEHLIYNLYNDLADTLEIDYKTSIWNNGISIYKYLCSEAKQTYSKAFPIILKEFTDLGFNDGSHIMRNFLCVNQERFNPINFGIDYHKDGYDGFACFWYDKGMWNFSLYNDNGEVDCSLIAKQYGGGGHKAASGFIIDDLNKVIR